MKPKVSIIIPVYNSEKTLKLCLDAIFRQTYKNFEVIIVDDCSKDNSYNIAKKYKKNNCKIIKLKKNSGPAVARNIGARYAKGEFLMFVDSDVALKKNVLSLIIEKFKKEPGLAAVNGIYAKKPLIRDSLVEDYRVLQEHYWQKSTAGYISSIMISIAAIKKNIFKEIGGFDERYKKADVEDVEFGHRLSQKYKTYMSPAIQGYHDSDDKLMKILKNISKRAMYRVKLFKRRGRFDNHYATPNRGLACILAFMALLTLPSIILNLWFFVIPSFFLFYSTMLDFGFYIFIYKEKGPLFLIYACVIHFLVNIAVFIGIVRGCIRLILKKVYHLLFFKRISVLSQYF